MQFPMHFPIKAIGKHTGTFELIVTEIVRRHAPDLLDADVVSRPSANGSYLAVTATFTARSREQLDALYRELTAHKNVLYVL
ncbi:MAG: DUF493 domain-containing protein [Chloroflexi bacterium]|nr:DUF493 domain-containing protein [Chloroflexota bacterium]